MILNNQMPKLSLDECIFLAMRRGAWWTFWDLQALIQAKTGKKYGEPTISCGIRNMRKSDRREKFGIDIDLSWDPVERKRIYGGKGYKYRLKINKEK